MGETHEEPPKVTKIITIDPQRVPPEFKKLRFEDTETPVSLPAMPNLRIDPSWIKPGDIIAFPPVDEQSLPPVFEVMESKPDSKYPEDPQVRRIFPSEFDELRKNRQPFPTVAVDFKKAA